MVTGSHLDSVPDGGAFDGPLGVVSALLAVDALRSKGFRPARPIGIVNFGDEEGARFGVACGGSRLITGALDADRARSLTDQDGVSMAEAIRRAGRDPARLGRDDETLRRIGTFVELHVEQGRGLIDLDRPVAVASAIWPHGRWRLTFEGQANHAGTTRLADRDDPMLALARIITTARESAARLGCVATVGKVRVEPNGVNAIPSRVTAWLDARGPVEADVQQIAAAVADAARLAATEESFTASTAFDGALGTRLGHAARRRPGARRPAPGTTPGSWRARVSPSAMLFVRNPTGVSHSPAEFAETTDCLAGVEALTAVLEELAS